MLLLRENTRWGSLSSKLALECMGEFVSQSNDDVARDTQVSLKQHGSTDHGQIHSSAGSKILS